MKVLFWGVLIFFISLIFHLVLWRISVPKRGMKALLQILFGTLVVTVLLLSILSVANAAFGQIAPRGMLEYIHICLFFTALALSYTITYSAIEAESPSIIMIMKIALSAPSGLPEKELEHALTDDILIKPRIKDLLNDKLIFTDKDKYRLTVNGAIFVRPFILYRRLLGLRKGG